MIVCEATAKKWGNSVGIVLSKDILEKGNIKENDTICVLLIKENQTPKKLFGMLEGKMHHSTQELKNTMRRELYND